MKQILTYLRAWFYGHNRFISDSPLWQLSLKRGAEKVSLKISTKKDLNYCETSRPKIHFLWHLEFDGPQLLLSSIVSMFICRFSWKLAPSQALACHQQGTGQPDVASASTLLHTSPHKVNCFTFLPITVLFCPVVRSPNCGARDQLRKGGVMSRMQVALASVLYSWLHLGVLYSAPCTTYFTYCQLFNSC